MKRYIWLVVIATLLLGCQKKHPVKVYVDPELKPGEIEKVAVFSFTSLLHPSEDPDGEAPRMLEHFFMPALDTRNDYNFIAPSSVTYAVQRLDVEKQVEEFLKSWPNTKKPDLSLLSSLSQALDCDAFLIPIVDLWQKDEADYQENASSATYVGATITLLDAENGTILFEASDEDYTESARTEVADRTIVRGGSGAVKSDFGANVYKAPPFEGVARKVVAALVASIPAR